MTSHKSWTRREKVAGIVCVAVHLFVLWNVWRANLLTPRIFNVTVADHTVCRPHGITT